MWTHLEGFEHLSEEEFDLLVDASALVTVLVGASDGELDREEHLWSEKLMRTRTYSSVKYLNDFYRVAAEGFWVRVQAIMAHYPQTILARNAAISERLAGLNDIFPKLEPKVAFHLYKGLHALAEEVAEASGGFLRIGAVNREESKWVELPMLNPIAAPPDAILDQEEEDESSDNQ
jgi:hypothetical protein